MNEKCFCHFNGYAVKDAKARKITDNFSTPEMFGAVGDGVADDTQALTQALAHSRTVILNGTYRITNRIVCSCKEIEGNNSTIISDFNTEMQEVLRFVDVPDVKITNLKINGNNSNMQYAMLISRAENVFLDNITVFNVYDLNTSTNSVMIAMFDCNNVNANQINVHDCYKMGDGVIDSGGGALYGFYSNNYDRATLTNSCFNEIHNINSNGNFIIEDSAGVYFKTGNVTSTTLIENVKGCNTGKRFIKIQNAGVVKIDSINFINTCSDFLVGIATMWSADESQTEPGNTTIVNSYIENIAPEHTSVHSFLIGCSDNVLVNNCVLKAQKGSVIIYTKDGNDRSDYVKFTDCDVVGCLAYSYTSIDNITFNNCSIKTYCLGYFTDRNNIQEGSFFKLDNCRVEICEEYNSGYKTYIFGVDNFIINNCEWIDNSEQMIEVKYISKIGLYNSQFILNKTVYPFYNGCDVVEVYNSNFTSKNNTNKKFMQIGESPETHVYIKNITDNNMEYIVFGSAHYHIGENINLSRFATNAGIIESCVPSYSDTAPAPAYTIGEGCLYTNTVDGKLYKFTNSNWVAVAQ